MVSQEAKNGSPRWVGPPKTTPKLRRQHRQHSHELLLRLLLSRQKRLAGPPSVSMSSSLKPVEMISNSLGNFTSKRSRVDLSAFQSFLHPAHAPSAFPRAGLPKSEPAVDNAEATEVGL